MTTHVFNSITALTNIDLIGDGNKVSIVASASTTGPYQLTLPVDNGELGEALITNGEGDLAWGTISGGSGITWATTVKLSSTVNIPNLAAPGAMIDSVSLTDTMRVLLRHQSDPIENGIYAYNMGITTLERATDMGAASTANNVAVYVEGGTLYGSKAFICLTDSGSDVVASDPITFDIFNFNAVTAGTGIAKSASNELTVDFDATSIALTGNEIQTIGVVSGGSGNTTLTVADAASTKSLVFPDAPTASGKHHLTVLTDGVTLGWDPDTIAENLVTDGAGHTQLVVNDGQHTWSIGANPADDHALAFKKLDGVGGDINAHTERLNFALDSYFGNRQVGWYTMESGQTTFADGMSRTVPSDHTTGLIVSTAGTMSLMVHDVLGNVSTTTALGSVDTRHSQPSVELTQTDVTKQSVIGVISNFVLSGAGPAILDQGGPMRSLIVIPGADVVEVIHGGCTSVWVIPVSEFGDAVGAVDATGNALNPTFEINKLYYEDNDAQHYVVTPAAGGLSPYAINQRTNALFRASRKSSRFKVTPSTISLRNLEDSVLIYSGQDSNSQTQDQLIHTYTGSTSPEVFTQNYECLIDFYSGPNNTALNGFVIALTEQYLIHPAYSLETIHDGFQDKQGGISVFATPAGAQATSSPTVTFTGPGVGGITADSSKLHIVVPVIAGGDTTTSSPNFTIHMDSVAGTPTAGNAIIRYAIGSIFTASAVAEAVADIINGNTTNEHVQWSNQNIGSLIPLGGIPGITATVIGSSVSVTSILEGVNGNSISFSLASTGVSINNTPLADGVDSDVVVTIAAAIADDATITFTKGASLPASTLNAGGLDFIVKFPQNVNSVEPQANEVYINSGAATGADLILLIVQALNGQPASMDIRGPEQAANNTWPGLDHYWGVIPSVDGTTLNVTFDGVIDGVSGQYSGLDSNTFTYSQSGVGAVLGSGISKGGLEPAVEIVMNDANNAKQFYQVEGKYFEVFDSGGKNGTFVGGDPVQTNSVTLRCASTLDRWRIELPRLTKTGAPNLVLTDACRLRIIPGESVGASPVLDLNTPISGTDLDYLLDQWFYSSDVSLQSNPFVTIELEVTGAPTATGFQINCYAQELLSRPSYPQRFLYPKQGDVIDPGDIGKQTYRTGDSFLTIGEHQTPSVTNFQNDGQSEIIVYDNGGPDSAYPAGVLTGTMIFSTSTSSNRWAVTLTSKFGINNAANDLYDEDYLELRDGNTDSDAILSVQNSDIINIPELVLWWRFEEGTGSTINDSRSSVENDFGTMITGTQFTWEQNIGTLQTGEWGIDFAGTNGDQCYIHENDIGTITLPFAVSVWIKPQDLKSVSLDAAWNTVWSLKISTSGSHHYYSLELGDADAASGKLTFKRNAHNVTHIIETSTVLVLENLYHVLVIERGSITDIYINGLKESVTDLESNHTLCVPTGNISQFTVGAANDAAGFHDCFLGIIDDVRFYKQPEFSDTDVHDIFKGRSSANSGGMLARITESSAVFQFWYKMEEGEGTTVESNGATANDLTIYNGANWEAGKTGNYALDFDGTNDFARYDAATADNDSNNYVSFWFNVEDKTVLDQCIWSALCTQPTIKGYSIRLIYEAPHARLKLIKEQPGVADTVLVDNSISIAINTWYHVVCKLRDNVSDDHANQLFLNGTALTLAQSGNTVWDSHSVGSTILFVQLASNLIASSETGTPSEPFGGKIDDVRHIVVASPDNVLSTNQIKAIYSNSTHLGGTWYTTGQNLFVNWETFGTSVCRNRCRVEINSTGRRIKLA